MKKTILSVLMLLSIAHLFADCGEVLEEPYAKTAVSMILAQKYIGLNVNCQAGQWNVLEVKSAYYRPWKSDNNENGTNYYEVVVTGKIIFNYVLQDNGYFDLISEPETNFNSNIDICHTLTLMSDGSAKPISESLGYMIDAENICLMRFPAPEGTAYKEYDFMGWYHSMVK